MDPYRIIEVKQSVFADNNQDADKLRRELKEQGTFLVNLMSSPGSGKTTYARENMGKDDILVDLDAIKAALLGNRKDEDFHSQISDDKVELLRLVQGVLKDAVHNGVTENKTWFLTTETDSKKLQEWCKYCSAELKIMETDKETCKKRVAGDDTRQNKELFYKLINNWFKEMKGGEKNES